MTGPLPRRLVFLIGFMGAGKTTVGKALAQRLGWKFYDLDELIETREQQSIAGIFATAGESRFRKIESATLAELLKKNFSASVVVALGGGTFVQAQNREALQRAGATVVLLNAPIEELRRRCGDTKTRPLAGDKTKFEQLFASRQSAYALADLKIETADKTVEQVAEEMARMLGAVNSKQ